MFCRGSGRHTIRAMITVFVTSRSHSMGSSASSLRSLSCAASRTSPAGTVTMIVAGTAYPSARA